MKVKFTILIEKCLIPISGYANNNSTAGNSEQEYSAIVQLISKNQKGQHIFHRFLIILWTYFVGYARRMFFTNSFL